MASYKKTMDGNEAAAHASYAFTEIASIYPITPASPMAELIDVWASEGRKNIFGNTVKLVEMQSEAGAVSAMHGALEAGQLASSYTSSQGLLLMIPTMNRIAGHLRPGVLHVASRSVATNAYSISAEHSDVMSCRPAGFAVLASCGVQEAMDLGAAAHLAAIDSSVPFLHFFDGFRTSHEIQKIDCLDYSDLAQLVSKENLERFRKSSLNPDRPFLHTPGLSPDVYFQAKEASNPYYEALPTVVEACLEKINQLTGRCYGLFNYHGAGDAEHVMVAMGSVTDTIRETVDMLNAGGGKFGVVAVHLYRPFSISHFLRAIPESAKTITVLDRTKEPGAPGEPLYADVCAAFNESEMRPRILACRFGLGGKDTNPMHIAAVFENAMQAEPQNHITIGIEDDLTNHSIAPSANIQLNRGGVFGCKFWGLGSDGTVGANKSAIKIIGDNTDKYVQAFFEYDGKKFGGVTKSHLRFGDTPIRSAYYVTDADLVACHAPSYVLKYDVIKDLREGGSFLLNCPWSGGDLERNLPDAVKNALAVKRARFFVIDATGIAQKLGMGGKINTILQASFFKIADILPLDEAIMHMKEATKKAYGKKGDAILEMNYAAIDKGGADLIEIQVPDSWRNGITELPRDDEGSLPKFVREEMLPYLRQEGSGIPVSVFSPDSKMPLGTSRYERRGAAIMVPKWDGANCIQCNMCAFVCPHAALRPFILDKGEAEGAPPAFKMVPAKGRGMEGYRFAIAIDPLDCVGCGSCAAGCPAGESALSMAPIETQKGEMENWDYALTISHKKEVENAVNVKTSQFREPLLQFPGACPGCGETPYAKLITQLYGERMYISTATGCMQVWATDYPIVPYSKNLEGRGPAFSNSLFENNGEFGLGIALAVSQQREQMRDSVLRLKAATSNQEAISAIDCWLGTYSDGEKSLPASLNLIRVLEDSKESGEAADIIRAILHDRELLHKKSVWCFGGDGWAYDIGFGGLDHVLSTDEDINILVCDTEVYSNTGGQSSKGTPRGATARFAAAGKQSRKKDLGMMAMSYGHVYVAQVCMGANPAQLLKAIQEAESYPGPSLIIAYAPCVNHGLVKGMKYVQQQEKEAVAAGYWHLYRFDPRRASRGENPFVLDSKRPESDYIEYLKTETRYLALAKTFPEHSEKLFTLAAKDAEQRYASYERIAEGYK